METKTIHEETDKQFGAKVSKSQRQNLLVGKYLKAGYTENMPASLESLNFHLNTIGITEQI